MKKKYKSAYNGTMRNNFQRMAAQLWIKKNYPQVWETIVSESLRRFPASKDHEISKSYSFIEKVKP